MGLVRNLFIFSLFAPTAWAIDVSGCPAGVYCNIPGEYRPAAVFGAGANGIQTVRSGVSENEELISAILVHELTIDPDNEVDNLGNRLISPQINKPYELDSLPFENPLEIPAIGYVLNPELFSTTESTAATLNRLSYPTRTSGGHTYSGVKIDNFGMSDIKIDFSEFGTQRNQSKIKVCGNIKLDIQTSLGFNFAARDRDYEVKVENVDIAVDTKETKELCFDANINMATFSVESITRIGDEPILTRQNLEDSFKKPQLKLTVPETTPLRQLDQANLNRMAAGYLLPVLSNDLIVKSIETPIFDNVQTVLQDQINTLISATLSNQTTGSVPDIRLPMFNISNDMVKTTLKSHLDGLEAMQRSGNMRCKHFINRMINVNYWSLQNPGFHDSETSDRINRLANSINPQNHRCRRKRDFQSALSNFKATRNRLMPSEQQTEELIIRQLNRLGTAGDLAVEVFIPELCEGDYTSALAGRSAPASCDDFYTMIDLSYINNYLDGQIEQGNLCQTNVNGKCGIRMIDGEGIDREGEEKPKFACEDMNSIGISGTGGGNMRATISLRNCMSKGRRHFANLGLWNLGSFDNTDFQLSYDVEISNQCPEGRKACFKIKFREDLFSYQGGLEDLTLEGSVKSALIEEMEKLEETLNQGLNGFPIEDFAVGLDITNFFGSNATETSPGHIGACLKTSDERGSRAQACLVAKLRLPSDHPALARHCQ